MVLVPIYPALVKCDDLRQRTGQMSEVYQPGAPAVSCWTAPACSRLMCLRAAEAIRTLLTHEQFVAPSPPLRPAHLPPWATKASAVSMLACCSVRRPLTLGLCMCRHDSGAADAPGCCDTAGVAAVCCSCTASLRNMRMAHRVNGASLDLRSQDAHHLRLVPLGRVPVLDALMVHHRDVVCSHLGRQQNDKTSLGSAGPHVRLRGQGQRSEACPS